MKRTATVLACALAFVLSVAGPALAAWSAHGSVAGAGQAGALTMPPGATPTVGAVGSAVTVTWAAVTTPPATGYTVRAYDAMTGTERAIGASCVGVLAALSCTETGVADGSWRYTVSAHLENWTGAESARSDPVTVETADPAPTALTLVNGTGGVVGRLDPELDEVRIQYSEPLAVSSICSAWSDDAADQTLAGSDVVVTITDNSGDNSLAVSSSQCSIDIGTLTLGADYLSGASATLSGTATHSSRVTWSAATRTLTVELGELTSGSLAATPVAAASSSYTPAAALHDLSGHGIVTTTFISSSQRF